MGRLKNISINPGDPNSVAEAVQEILRVLDREVGFGDPLDPTSDNSVVLAGGTGATSHNGTPSNIAGAWVELEFEALDTPVTATHNLNAPVINNEVNVRIASQTIRHSGVGATVASCLSINYEDGDTITSNSIQLRAYCTSGRTVNAANPVRVSLYLIPVTRWPN